MVSTKYLLCFPLSGLNDLLNRVWKCYAYAKEHHRTLVIDSRFSFLCDAFANYFEIHSNDVVVMDVEMFYQMICSPTAQFTYFPPQLSASDIRSRLRPRLRSIDDRVHTVWNNILLSTSLDTDHHQDVVVYASCGGGNGAIHLLRHCRLAPPVIALYEERRRRLPTPYNAIHIRNTDKRSSDLESFLASHRNMLETSTVFVASDDVEILTHLRHAFGVKTFANIPKLTSCNIHYDHPSVPHREFNLDSIVDMLLLASSSTFKFSCPSSGYSKLARALFHHTDVLHQLLRHDEHHHSSPVDGTDGSNNS